MLLPSYTEFYHMSELQNMKEWSDLNLQPAKCSRRLARSDSAVVVEVVVPKNYQQRLQEMHSHKSGE